MTNMACFYGDSGDGKTSLLGTAVNYMIKKYPDGIARLTTADNTDVIQPYVDAGKILVWPIRLWDHPFEIWDYASRGYWPEDPFNPKSKILAPTADTWKKVRLNFFEGISHGADMMMERLSNVGGEGTYIGPGTRVNTQKGEADLISFKDGTYGVGGSAQAHYNVVQKETRKNIFNSSVLPVPAIWTAHVCKASEDGKPIFGPQVVGNKATPKVQSWFSSLVHVHSVIEKNKISYRLYLRDHIDNSIGPITFKALQRVPLPLLDPKLHDKIKEVWDSIVPEYIEWTNNSNAFEEYMSLKAKMNEAAKKIILGGI